ncbi:hypothetical protein [Paenibacillus sp. TSA_86.1]|uniref:hypothetical protein n=1 Tax=Paenibacillus sp. TSA_86.1 TaxID=3415649 RepID=UPI004046171F
MIHPKYESLLEQQEQLLSRKNEVDSSFYNGVLRHVSLPSRAAISLPLMMMSVWAMYPMLYFATVLQNERLLQKH